MKLELTTPALLFTAISLLISAYTSRFATLAQLLRQLDLHYRKTPEKRILAQIKNLNKRIRLIKYMQTMGVFSFFLCVLSMLALFLNKQVIGQITFGISLVALLISLLLSLLELQISVNAIVYQLEDLTEMSNKLEDKNKTK
ncbi:DUF2721 domain-containing protein [Clostridium folliculivorans]|uniref:DUF2721 domain-containing protein n=1 Tax=Clostridium folliculivorans TaxID=2886038 RepID=A0A9W6D9J1_9CLOT|nr:DUF2721 domain-containing protein [Clostridium folliculivorans]GKU23822.1 DUF2721 domain-containing protein [Clostridium folliculivorans]GKU29938.1 DUF2721 domain-containing protein [Clostridium folliculivorans]